MGSDEVRKRGLNLKLETCCVWSPTAPPAEVQAAYPPNVLHDYSPGTTIVNTPLGSDDFVYEEFTSHVQSLRVFFDALPSIEEVQVAYRLYTLIRFFVLFSGRAESPIC